MYIQPTNNYNINMCGGKNDLSFWKRIYQKILDKTPNIIIKDNKEFFDKVDTFCSHPAYNRMIMGSTALVTQPFIDANNKRVDENTRKISTYRTIAKIIAGTVVGIIVRGICFELIKKMTDLNGTTKFSRALLPENYINKILTDKNTLKRHRNTSWV